MSTSAQAQAQLVRCGYPPSTRAPTATPATMIVMLVPPPLGAGDGEGWGEGEGEGGSGEGEAGAGEAPQPGREFCCRGCPVLASSHTGMLGICRREGRQGGLTEQLHRTCPSGSASLRSPLLRQTASHVGTLAPRAPREPPQPLTLPQNPVLAWGRTETCAAAGTCQLGSDPSRVLLWNAALRSICIFQPAAAGSVGSMQ